MNPAFAVFIMMNNYFHDVATAMLMASGIVMWVIIKRHEEKSTPESRDFMLAMHTRVSKIVVISLIWITASAIPRILTFRSYEWTHAVNRHIAAGLLAKHIVAFAILISGTYLWIAINRKLKFIRNIT